MSHSVRLESKMPRKREGGEASGSLCALHGNTEVHLRKSLAHMSFHLIPLMLLEIRYPHSLLEDKK